MYCPITLGFYAYCLNCKKEIGYTFEIFENPSNLDGVNFDYLKRELDNSEKMSKLVCFNCKSFDTLLVTKFDVPNSVHPFDDYFIEPEEGNWDEDE